MQPLTLDWLHLVLLLGTIQGVILGGVLVARRTNRTANRLLAALMFSFSLFLASGVYHAAGFERRWPHFFGIGYPQPFLFGPLLFLYARHAADRTRRFTRWDAAHFAPFLLSILVGAPLYLSSGEEKLAFYAAALRGDVPGYILVQDVLKFASGLIYTAATLALLMRHAREVKDSYSSLERVNLRWLLWLGGGAAFIWGMAVVLSLLGNVGVIGVQRGDDVVAVLVALLIYAIGYMGLRQPEIFRFNTAEYPVPRAAEERGEPAPAAADGRAPALIVSDGGAPADAPTARYERSGLSERQAERLKEALTTLMETERPWTDSGLTLADLATRLRTTPHKLSEVLNTQIGQTFYDYVNGYRVREVQRRIAAGDARKVKLLALAMDAGFASKSTFNLVFKKHTNQTPSDYQAASGF